LLGGRPLLLNLDTTAAAVEEQSAVTGDMSSNMQKAVAELVA
jgi:hypothetical protein